MVANRPLIQNLRCISGSIVTCGGFMVSSLYSQFELLYLTLGAAVGYGTVLLLLVSMSMIPQYFDKHLGLATAITTSGYGIGLFMFSIINHYLVSNYGLQGSLLILAAFSLQAIPLGLLMKVPYTKNMECQELSAMPEPKEQSLTSSCETLIERDINKLTKPDLHENCVEIDENQPLISGSSNCPDTQISNEISQNADHRQLEENPSNQNQNSTKHGISTSLTKGLVLLVNTTGLDLFLNKQFTLVIVSSALVILPHYVVPTILPDHVHSLGFTQQKADNTLTMMGAANSLCRFLIWKLTSDFDTNLNILALTSVISGVSIICCVFYESYWMYVVFSLVFGSTRGVFFVYFILVTITIVGKERSHHGFGVGLTCRGLAVLCGMPGFGALADATRERWGYNLLFLSLGSAEIIAGLLFIVLKVVRKHR